MLVAAVAFIVFFAARNLLLWFGLAVVGISGGKVPDPGHVLLEPGDFSTVFLARERRFPVRLAKDFWQQFF